MEGRNIEELGELRDELTGTFLHFGSNFIGESDREDPSRVDARLADEIRDAIRKNASLSRARTGDDANMLSLGRDSGQLLWVE